MVCEAINEFGKASSEAMLLVLPRGEPPDFLEWLSNVRARQGSKVSLLIIIISSVSPLVGSRHDLTTYNHVPSNIQS